MTDLRKAAEMALEALMQKGEHHPKVYQAAEALRQALAQPEQEPVAWFVQYSDSHELLWSKPEGWRVKQALEIQPLYTALPKREWVGLTDEEIYDMYNEPRSDAEMVAFAREVEAKLKEKNTWANGKL